MDRERRDDVNKLYLIHNVLNTGTNIIFYVNIVITFALLFKFKYKEYVIMANIILIIIYALLTILNEMYFTNLAENERRKSLIRESFDIPITLKKTNKYYNNNESPSIEKLGLNSYESVFFTRKNVDKMLPVNVIENFFLILLYIIFMIQLKNMDILLVITQTIFSSECLFYCIKLIYYKIHLGKLEEKFQNIFFITNKNDKNRNILIFDSVLEYECLKRYCQISISSKLFLKYNDKWSNEWNNIVKQIENIRK